MQIGFATVEGAVGFADHAVSTLVGLGWGALHRAASEALAAGRTWDAVDLLSEAVDLEPLRADLLVARAAAYTEAGEQDRARNDR